MLEPPDVPDAQIADCVQTDYGLTVKQIEFLPLGADVNSAVYRVIDGRGQAFFLKLRRGLFEPAPVLLPHRLALAGVGHVIAPLVTASGQLWTRLRDYTVTLFPFVNGDSGWGRDLTSQQWSDLGRTLRALHTTNPDQELRRHTPLETYTPRWREQVRGYLRQIDRNAYANADEPARGLAALLVNKRRVVEHLVDRAEELGTILSHQAQEFCLCHGDIHAGNVLIDPDGKLYVVDWDTLVMAPRERDLMFIGAGISPNWRSQQERDWFYAGYGPAEINQTALAYYRIERIVQDIAAFGEQLFDSAEGGDDRQQALRWMTGQFASGDVIEIALATDQNHQGEVYRYSRGARSAYVRIDR